MAEVKVGNWYSLCCQRDLEIIESDEDVEHVNDLIADNFGVDIYESKLEALLDIRAMWVRSKENNPSNPEPYQEEIDNCDEMIRHERAQQSVHPTGSNVAQNSEVSPDNKPASDGNSKSIASG